MMEFLQQTGFLMMPFEEQYNIENLKEKFNVFELPTFIVMDRYTNVISRDGLHDVKKYTKQ